MNKVFIVLLDHDWGNYDIVGVYNSQFKADEHRKELLKKGHEKGEVKVEDWTIE